MPAGNFTGELLLRTRPRTYFRIIALLAENQPVTYIEKACKVSEHTVNAISERRATDIAERKRILIANMGDVAEIGSERMGTLIGKASLRDATIGTGVAIDKLLALTGQLPSVNVAVVMPNDTERADMRTLDQKLDEIARRLTQATPKVLDASQGVAYPIKDNTPLTLENEAL